MREPQKKCIDRNLSDSLPECTANEQQHLEPRRTRQNLTAYFDLSGVRRVLFFGVFFLIFTLRAEVKPYDHYENFGGVLVLISRAH